MAILIFRFVFLIIAAAIVSKAKGASPQSSTMTKGRPLPFPHFIIHTACGY